MARVVWIGLSLGADLCWPLCFEEMLKMLNLKIKIKDEELIFKTERITIEPFSLRQECKYTVVLDRVTHWYHTSREWIKKAILLDNLYVLNNPWSIQSMEKQTTYCAMMRLGLNIPETWMVPPKAYEMDPMWKKDLEITLKRYARLFDLGAIGEKIGYPIFMKPYDGGAWVGVSKIHNSQELWMAYERSGKRVMHLQKAVEPYDLFVRCIGLGPQVRIIHYDPSKPLHDRYRFDDGGVNEKERAYLENATLTINNFFGWDFNSCEVLRSNGNFFFIDFANACPDSQVTSLHYHFPWLVVAKLKWALFCAATNRKMHYNLQWDPYFEIADSSLPFEEKLNKYGEIARKNFSQEQFLEFCDKYLPHIDEVADQFFASDKAKLAVRLKVESLYPPHEVEEFTELFWQRIQEWRKRELHGEGQPKSDPLQ